jgi:hypothetical protein
MYWSYNSEDAKKRVSIHEDKKSWGAIVDQANVLGPQ